MSAAIERMAAIALWALSAWPLWAWWVRRLADPIDADVASWVVFAALAAMLWRKAGRKAFARPLPIWKWLFSAFFLLIFHSVRGVLPSTASSVFAVLAGLPLLLPEDTGQWAMPSPLVALALMGLPSAMMVDLFLGFPLRVVATRLAGFLLAVIGLPVAVSGVELSVDGVAVWVDAPCSGIRMLGAGLVLAFALAQVFGFREWRTLALAAVGLVAIILANAVRVVALTFCEVSGIPLSAAAHEAVGCAAFLPGAALCAVAAFVLARRPER